MIYCNLRGGFGNLLFQFATSYAFARERGVDFSFPNFDSQIRLLNDDVRFNPSLKHAEEYIDIFERFPFKKESPSINLGKEAISFPFQYCNLIPKDGDIFDGYFQSEKYFCKYRQEILDMLQPHGIIKDKLEKEIGKLPNKYNAVHVRLGDYMKNPNFHTNVPFSYYHRAIKEIDSDLPWIVFSDSIEICKENFNRDTFIFSENVRDYLEMYLMSRAENIVISNSSFSWWAAWIGERDMKNIVSPDPSCWFGSDPYARSINTSDIIPHRWRKILL